MKEPWVSEMVHEAYAAHTILCNLGFEPDDIEIGIAPVINTNPPGPHIVVKLEREGRRFVIHLRPAPRRDQKVFLRAFRKFIDAKPNMDRAELDRIYYGSWIYKQRVALLEGLLLKGFELRPGEMVN